MHIFINIYVNLCKSMQIRYIYEIFNQLKQGPWDKNLYVNTKYEFLRKCVETSISMTK